MLLDPLNPAVYFPLTKARFSITPGFYLITKSFGNGAMDARLFQIDRDFARFRDNKIAVRTERLAKYIAFDDRFDALAPDVCRLMMIRLMVEYPVYFTLEQEAEGAGNILCRLTGERIVFDRAMRLLSVQSENSVAPGYSNLFDALLSQVPEDMAVISLPAGEPDANLALHVCSPSHWSPQEKIGASFLQTHAPVPGFEKIAGVSVALLEAVRTRPPLVRFNWGIEFTERLNLHPEPPPGADANDWNRRTPLSPDAIYLRIERQVLWGMEAARAALFAIRIYCRPIADFTGEERRALRETLLTMPDESRLYKGLPPESFAQVVDVLVD